MIVFASDAADTPVTRLLARHLSRISTRRSFTSSGRAANHVVGVAVCASDRICAALFEGDPSVIVWDDAARVLVVIVKLRWQDDGLWLGLLPWPRHGVAPMATAIVQNLSSVATGVGYGSTHKHLPDGVDKRQATAGRLIAEPANDHVDVGFAPPWLLSLSLIHRGRSRVA